MNENIIGYFIYNGGEQFSIVSRVFIAIDEVADNKGNITCYCPIGQHGALNREYLKECREITKEEYIEYSKGFYTPEEYL